MLFCKALADFGMQVRRRRRRRDGVSWQVGEVKALTTTAHLEKQFSPLELLTQEACSGKVKSTRMGVGALLVADSFQVESLFLVSSSTHGRVLPAGEGMVGR